MKVLLVNANRMKPAIAPVGLDYLADSLEEEGHETRLLDLCFSESPWDEIKLTAKRFPADIVGMTIRNTDDCYFAGQSFFLPEMKGILQKIRTLLRVPVVLGGAGYSIAPEAILDFCGADFGIVGEGEWAFPLLLSALQQRKRLEDVPNLVYQKNGTVVRNCTLQGDLSSLPLRRRIFVDNPVYFSKGGQAGFETKRGCAKKCIYCADPVSKGPFMRLLPPRNVVAELAALVYQGIDHFHTCDSEFNLPCTHAKQVCQEIIEHGIAAKIHWYAYCSPIPFDEETAKLMKRAGCGGINFGVDSASDRVLDSMGRDFTTADLARTAQLCRRHQLPFMYDLLLGGPAETRATVRETFDFVRRVGADCIGVSAGIRVYRGTPLANLVLNRGRMETNPDLHGAKSNNPDFLKPVFYVASVLGDDFIDYVHDLVAGDPRFFLPDTDAEGANYNYNQNQTLVRAIEKGARGAYWDILRRLR